MATYPERTNYFIGRLLGVEDFQREQDYLIGRQRRHNRYAHGWGVLHGLGIHVEGDAAHIEPGMAIDCEGNELELVEQSTVNLSFLSTPVYVGLAFVETQVAPIPTQDGVQYGATRESAQLTIESDNACAAHAHRGPGTPGCGLRHPVVLARLSKHNEKWRVRLAKKSGA